MSTTAPRCHLCLEVKRLMPSTGLLTCDHCDKPCSAAAERRECAKCEQGQKSNGRGPRS